MATARTRPSGLSIAVWLTLAAVIVYLLRFLLIPFVVAGAISYVTYPVVKWVERRLHLPHILASMLVYIVFLAVAGSLSYAIVTMLASDLVELSANAPRILHSLVVQLTRGQGQFLGKPVDADQITHEILAGFRALLTSSEGGGRLLLGAVEFIPMVVLTVVLLIYFYITGPRVTKGLLWLVPPAYREEVHSLAIDVRPILDNYIRSLIIVVTYATTLAWLCIGPILKMHYSVLLGLTTGLMELVPMVGPVASAVIVGTIAIEEGSVETAIGVTIFFIVLRLSIDQVIAPLVMGRAVTLQPVAIMFAFLTGGLLFGIFGLLVAIPVAATAKVALARAYGEDDGLEEAR